MTNEKDFDKMKWETKMLTKDLELKDKDLELKDKDLKLKDKDLDIKDKLSRVAELTRELANSKSSLAAFNSRALIEFVEKFKIPNFNKRQRKECWVIYFKSEEGSVLFNCLKETNRLWVGIPESMAEKMVHLYSVTSDVQHGRAHNIADGAEIILEKLQSTVQQYNVLKCLAQTYSLNYKELEKYREEDNESSS